MRADRVLSTLGFVIFSILLLTGGNGGGGGVQSAFHNGEKAA